MTPNLTDAGKNLLLRALTGETITFTKIQLGNGPAQDARTATGLVNPLLTGNIRAWPPNSWLFCFAAQRLQGRFP